MSPFVQFVSVALVVEIVMKTIYFSLVLLLSIGFLARSQAQEKHDEDPPARFAKSSSKGVGYDPWVPTTPATSFRGEIVYDDFAAYRDERFAEHDTGSHIFVRPVGSAISSSVYAATWIKPFGGGAYAPQFSPDGRFVLWKFGMLAFSHSFYEIYVLDLKTAIVRRVEDVAGKAYKIRFRDVRWSPDSNFLAWIEDLDVNGNRVDFDQPASIRVCNWRTGQSHIVATGDGMRYAFSWTGKHTLLWSQLPLHPTLLPAPPTSSSPKASGQLPSAEDEPLIKEHPSLFEVDAGNATAKSHEVLPDAFRAVVSPSGGKVAFFGSYDILKPYPLRHDWDQVSGSAMYLSVANRDGSHRQFLNIQAGEYPQVLWQHDDQHLLTVEVVQGKPYTQEELNQVKSDVPVGVAYHYVTTLRQFDILTHKVRVVSDSLISSAKMLGVSSDDQTLFFSADKIIGRSKTQREGIIQWSLIALDLKTGKQILMAQTINALGLDWHEDSSAPTEAK